MHIFGAIPFIKLQPFMTLNLLCVWVYFRTLKVILVSEFCGKTAVEFPDIKKRHKQ